MNEVLLTALLGGLCLGLAARVNRPFALIILVYMFGYWDGLYGGWSEIFKCLRYDVPLLAIPLAIFGLVLGIIAMDNVVRYVERIDNRAG